MNRPATEQTIGPMAALFLIPASFVLFGVMGELSLEWGVVGLALMQLVGFALPSWLAARRAGRPAAILALVRPSGRALAGAALVAGSYWVLSAALLVPLVEDLITEDEVRVLAEHLSGPEPLVARLLLFALLPALCEELLFRGAIARGLRPRLGLVGAAVLSSAYFALLHGSVARLPITFALAMVLALVTLRSGSLVPAIAIHAGNNAAAVLLTWPPLAPTARFLGGEAAVLVPLALLATGLGLTLLWRAGGDRTPLVSDATSL
jgi:membrane protease YdiL (CAAX protease family)